MLELNAETMVKRVDDGVSEIPRHAFEFVELDNLEPNANEHFVGIFLIEKLSSYTCSIIILMCWNHWTHMFSTCTDAIGVIATAGNLEQKDIRGSATKLLNIEIATLR